MRGPTEYQSYLLRMRSYYRIKGLPCPSWVDNAWSYYSKVYNIGRSLYQMCSDTAIPKSEMEWLSKVEDKTPEDLPKELIDGCAGTNSILIEMYNELISNKELYFINEWTLSKKGRKKMREYIDRLPSVDLVKPPKNSFTNVPKRIDFANRINGYKAEYEMTISLNGSRVFLRNGDAERTESIEFTEEFLDKIIPLAQWENLKYMLHRRDRWDPKDESVYQGFDTVLVDIDWNECDLNLKEQTEENPFIAMMKLVWDVYGEIIVEKGLVLPWFNTLGLV